MKNLFAKKKGFTLIEILVVIAIIMLLSFMAINGYMDYRKSSLLNLAGDNLISQINQQKTRTVYGKTDAIEDSAKCYGVYFKDAGIYTFSQYFNSLKKFVGGDWVYTGCGAFNFGDRDSLEMDEMIKILTLKLNNENALVEVPEPFAIRFYPPNGDIELIDVAEGEALEITLQYGELTDYQKTFTYNF